MPAARRWSASTGSPVTRETAAGHGRGGRGGEEQAGGAERLGDGGGVEGDDGSRWCHASTSGTRKPSWAERQTKTSAAAFQHSGVNYFRLMEAASSDILHGHRGQGGSTLTMQLSRGFFLTPEKTVKRKLTEMLIAIELEQKFSKQRIFEMYANQVPMGSAARSASTASARPRAPTSTRT